MCCARTVALRQGTHSDSQKSPTWILMYSLTRKAPTATGVGERPQVSQNCLRYVSPAKAEKSFEDWEGSRIGGLFVLLRGVVMAACHGLECHGQWVVFPSFCYPVGLQPASTQTWGSVEQSDPALGLPEAAWGSLESCMSSTWGSEPRG